MTRKVGLVELGHLFLTGLTIPRVATRNYTWFVLTGPLLFSARRVKQTGTYRRLLHV